MKVEVLCQTWWLSLNPVTNKQESKKENPYKAVQDEPLGLSEQSVSKH